MSVSFTALQERQSETIFLRDLAARVRADDSVRTFFAKLVGLAAERGRRFVITRIAEVVHQEQLIYTGGDLVTLNVGRGSIEVFTANLIEDLRSSEASVSASATTTLSIIRALLEEARDGLLRVTATSNVCLTTRAQEGVRVRV